jgi:hypothetical protein
LSRVLSRKLRSDFALRDRRAVMKIFREKNFSVLKKNGASPVKL